MTSGSYSSQAPNPGRVSSDHEQLLARARAGDHAAWDELINKCYDKVRRVVRRRLDPPMRSLFDSTDFANEVFHSLYAKFDRMDFPSLEALKAHLKRAAEQKVIDAYREQYRLKRNLKLKKSFEELGAEPTSAYEPPASDPTPSQQAQAREVQDQLLEAHSGEDRVVLELRAQHYSNEEIAAQTGLHLRKVQRFLKKLSDSWYSRAAGGRS